MKYIRTNDGIYEVVGFDEECIIPSILIKVKNNYLEKRITHCCTYDIIKDADTVEELCDEFVGLVKSKSSDFIIMRVIAHSLKELKDSLKTELNGKTYYSKYDIIYGAIYTDKGLIYVAKMNENGELELI